MEVCKEALEKVINREIEYVSNGHFVDTWFAIYEGDGVQVQVKIINDEDDGFTAGIHTEYQAAVTKMQDPKEKFLAAHREAEKAAHEYFQSCEVGDERTVAATVYERIRTATRIGLES